MDSYASDEPGLGEVQRLLEEPERHGDVIDALIVVGFVIALVLSLGAALLLIDTVWNLVGLGEGNPSSNP
ncbi:MAG TPA: hypothetical protein VGB18_07190 [Candidatus Thermoplasmatota archaeon]